MVNIFYRIPLQGVAFEPCYGGKRSFDVWRMVYFHCFRFFIGHSYDYLVVAFDVSRNERLVFFAVQSEQFDFVAETVDGDVEYRVAVFEVR